MKNHSIWKATRTTDPITGASSCVVAAYDRFGKFNYSRLGYLYPVIENNSVYGLLVGVSSGGTIRIPAGDILWRVDNLPFRELKAADNPAQPDVAAAPLYKTGNDEVNKLAAKTTSAAMKAARAMMSTSTVASGDKARTMLDELSAGKTLIYRSATVAPAYGLPSDQQYRVGQITSEGIKPFSIDESFHVGLAECGITENTAKPS